MHWSSRSCLILDVLYNAPEFLDNTKHRPSSGSCGLSYAMGTTLRQTTVLYRLFVSKSTTMKTDTFVVGQKIVHKCPVQTFVLLLIGPPGIASGEARPPGDNGYHFVFMPSHLFPAYPSYRWGAIVADRCEDSACLHSSTICHAPVVFLHGWLLMHGSCHG